MNTPFDRLLLRISKLNYVKFHYPFPNKSVGVLDLGDGYRLQGNYTVYYNDQGILYYSSSDPEYKLLSEAIDKRRNEIEQEGLNKL